uniref:Uncharacterized protein n=1 Tax=Neobodo designis TaxID=312471 RepID=A0A7S1LY97_NEODS|mmetsp:Transcript_30732/g.94956  ORF Transcript_30732/g.94956 Transcript_30732/m.94956 type:complete len:655 (+) Transcript_30732:2-1966(+)
MKVDCSNPAITFVVEPKKGGKGHEHVLKVPSLGGPGSWVVPAVSLASPGAGATFDSLLDTTPLDTFGTRLADAEDLCFECCALGNYFLRWHRRMEDNQTVKAGGATLTKTDVRLRAVLCGSETTPVWGRSPLAGIFDTDATRRKLCALYNELCHEVITDAAQAKRLADLAKAPPANLKLLVLRCASPIVLGMALAHAAAPPPSEAASPASPAVASPAKPLGLSESVVAEKELTTQLRRLQERVESLEEGAASPEPTALNITAPSSSNLKRTQSKAGGAPAAANLRRRTSTTGAAPAGGARVVAKRPVSRTITRPTTKKTGDTKPSKPVAKSVSTANGVLSAVHSIRKLHDDHHLLAQKGSPTDADMKQMKDLEDAIAKAKVKAARDIAGFDAKQVEKWCDDETKGEVNALLEEVVPKGDHRPGSLELVRTLLTKLSHGIDFAAVVKELNLAAMAAYDGSVEFLKLFLNVPNLSIDLVELVECALFNQTHRIPVTLLLVNMWDTLGLDSVADEITDVWQEFFEDICSEERSKEREDRTGRMQLITKMLQRKSPKIDPMAEGSDGQTPFSRAAREGDMDLMTTLISTAPSAININHVSSIDKTTALIQAVMKNRTHVVKALASLPTLDKKHECEEGSALAIAKALKRDPEIIKALS